MAREPKKKVDIVGDFTKMAPTVWKVAFYASLAPFARLASDMAMTAMRDKASEITGGSKFAEVSGASALINIVEDKITKSLNGRPQLSANLRMKKEATGYRFNLRHKESGVLSLGALTLSLPGSVDILNSNSAAPDSDIFGPILEGLKTAGIDIKALKFDEWMDVPFTEIETETEFGAPAGQSNISTILKNSLPKDFKIETAAYKIEIGCSILFTNIPGMQSVDIDPYMEVIVHPDAFNSMSESEDANAKVFLGLTWMQQAVHNGVIPKSTKKWESLPYVDLRIASSQLSDVIRNHGGAKARVNKDGMCISEQGIPVFVPSVDMCAAYMQDMGKPVKDDQGFVAFDDALEQWANKVILTDWLNDALVYTDEKGKLKVYRMQGFIELDKNSEYVFLQTPITDVNVKAMMQTIVDTGSYLVTPDEATEFLPQAYKASTAYNGGRVTDSIGSLMTQVRIGMQEKLGTTDDSFIRDNQYVLNLKHMIGQDLSELPGYRYDMCVHIAAYLKALASKRKKMDQTSVMSRLLGFDWLLVAAQKADVDYPIMKEFSIKQRASLKSAPLLQEIDIPNMDAGGNLQGLLPHQYRILSNRFQGVADGNMAVSAGGGKTLMLLADILKKKLDNPTWKPLILSKGRLIPNFISEINYFTKGKVNCFSLNGRTIRYMKRTLKIDSAEKFFKYIRSLPTNTVFLCSYTNTRARSKFFNDLNVPTRMFDTNIALPQMMHIMRLIGFEMVRCDESHMIKNMASKQSQASYSLLAQAKEKLNASGTQQHNTVVDMLGQSFGLNPMIFGKSPEVFKDRYNISSGLIDQEGAQIMKRRLNKFVQENVASKEDWAYLLPDLVDAKLLGTLTPFQTDFYNKILQRALAQMKAQKEGKEVEEQFKDPTFAPDPRFKVPEEDTDDEDEDDDEDEAEDEEENVDEDDDAGGLTMDNLTRSLQKVESFIAAPDENEEYIRLVPPPSAADLVSPMVALVDAKLDIIYANLNMDHWNNKTAVFGINKAASRHFMKHSRWANKALWYTAGNEEVIRRFKTENNQWILVADSTSLREGENLQMLSHIFELQCVWSPGDFEQLVSRMYRPDPKGTYNKEKIYHYWCVNNQANGRPDINSIKLARMASKAISLARYQYSDDKRWMSISKQFDDLDMLVMSYEFIEGARQVDLELYQDSWVDFVQWQTGLNRANREKFATQLEFANPGIKLLDNNGNVIDRKLFTSMAMKPVVSTKMIQGSKPAYTPWERNATPADPYNMGLVILGGQDVNIGDYVMTEFGPGIVQGVSKNKLVIELSGLKKAKLSRRSVGVALNPQGKAKLAEMIRSPSIWKSNTLGPVDVLPSLDVSASLAPRGSAKPKTSTLIIPTTAPPITSTKPDIQPPAPPPGKTKPIVDERPVLEEIYTYLFNGMPAIVVEDPPAKVVEMGWNIVPDYVTVSFRDWSMAEKFIDLLANKFHMSGNNYNKLKEEMVALKQGRALKLMQQIKDSEVRNFFRTEMSTPKEVKGVEVVHPYWIAVDHEVTLAFSKKSHAQSVLRWLKFIQGKNPGKIKAVTTVQGFGAKIFNNATEAAEDIRKIGEFFDIPEAALRTELREMREDLKALKAPIRTPGAKRTVEVEEPKPIVKTKPTAIPAPKTKPTTKVKTTVKTPVKKPLVKITRKR